MCPKSNETVVIKSLLKYIKVKVLQSNPSTCKHLCIRFLQDSKHSWKAFSGIFLSSIIESLEMRKLCAKTVSKILSEYQRQQRFTVCQDITEHLKAELDLLNSVITGDEKWVFEYNPETKRQSREWKSYGSPRPMKARKSKSKVKVMLIVFFDIQGIVHFESLPSGQTVNQTSYKEILRHLVRSVHDKRWSLWEANAWVLHHDNARSHTTLSICQFLAERNIATLEHPPIFPQSGPM